jgi:hypothetical protein
MSKSPYKKVKLPAVPTFDYYNRNNVPISLRQACERFKYSQIPYVLEGEDTLFHKKFTEFTLIGGTLEQALIKYAGVVDYLKANEDKIYDISVWTGYGCPRLHIGYWEPFLKADLVKLEEEKVKANDLKAKVAKARKEAAAEKRKAASKATAGVKEDELVDIGKALAVLKKAGVDVTIRSK